MQEMNSPLIYILKIYSLITIPPGIIILILANRHYFQGYLLGVSLGLLDIFLLTRSFKGSLNYSKAIISMLLRMLVFGAVVLLLFVCDIINRLNIVGLVVGLLLYPIAIILGGLKIIRWKR
jgi:hypothetical protein